MFGGFGYACLASAYFTTAHIGDKATPWVVMAGCLEGLSAAMVSFHYNHLMGLEVAQDADTQHTNPIR